VATNFFQRWSSRSLTAKDTIPAQLSATNEPAIEFAQAEQAVIAEELVSDVADETVESVVDNSAVDDVVGKVSSAGVDKNCDDVLTIVDADSVTFDSGVASFLQQGVEKSVKKAALAKLFHSEEFNYISDMDDHTEDFSNIPKLDPSIAKQLRGWVNKVLDEPETETELVQDAELEQKTALAEQPETEPVAEQQQMASVEAEITGPVPEEHELSPADDESDNKAYQQGGT